MQTKANKSRGSTGFTSAALYVRVSTGRQAQKDLSIPNQRLLLHEHCERHGLDVAEEFADTKSARDGNRPDLQRLLTIVLDGQADFDVVLVHSFSRFFRKLVDAAVFIDNLRTHGVEIVSITQPLPHGPAGDMMRYFLMIFDEYQSIETAKHVRRSLHENARQGFWNGGTPPYGYMTVDAEVRVSTVKKVLAVEKTEAETVRMMFDLYLEGDGSSGPMGVMSVVKWLNSHGFRIRSGGRWSIGKVHDILTNRALVGTYLYGRSRKESDPVEVKVPAIVPDTVFAAAQETLRARNPKNTPPRVTTGPILLTGLVTCGCCGAGMTTTTGKGGRYRYYSCATLVRYGAGTCEGRRVPMDDLDDLITKHVLRELLTPSKMNYLLERLFRRQAARDVEKSANVARHREKYNAAQARLERYYDFIDAGTVDPNEPTLKERIEHATTERKFAKNALDRCSSELSPSAQLTEEKVAALSGLLRKEISSGTIGHRRSFLRAIIKRIQIGESGITIAARKSELERMALAVNGTDPRVPSFVPGWRRRCPPNRSFNRKKLHTFAILLQMHTTINTTP